MTETMQYRFIQTLDVLYLRGNKLFGGAGDHAQALMPPWPSIAAGALRSRMLTDSAIDLEQFGNHKISGSLEKILGTPQQPGSFEIALFSVARLTQNQLECFYPLPADVFLAEQTLDQGADYLQPQPRLKGIRSSHQLAQMALLKTACRSKPQSAYWLRQSGWDKYQQNSKILLDDMIPQMELWQTDMRLGIALDTNSNTAAESQIYTTEVIQFMPDTGFITAVKGVGKHLPQDGLIRIGADGHAATIQPVEGPENLADWNKIKRQGSFKIITTTPAIFAAGWLPPGIDRSERIMKFGNSQAKLVCTTMNRHQVISGWDLAKRQPKDAYKTVPVGSVYWFDKFDGDIKDLQQLQQQGFWNIDSFPDKQRQAEGFNQLIIAPWAKNNEEA